MTTSAEIDATVAGKTVTSMFRDTVARNPDGVALRWKEGEAWKEWTFAQVADLACRAATGLRAAGIGKGDRIVLMMRNIPEFHVIDLAALLVGATPVSIYNSSSHDQVEFLAEHCKAKLAFVEAASFHERFRPGISQLTELQAIGVIHPEGTEAELTWDSLIANDPVDLDEASRICAPDDLVTVIYTSGTTGPPKGVMSGIL